MTGNEASVGRLTVRKQLGELPEAVFDEEGLEEEFMVMGLEEDREIRPRSTEKEDQEVKHEFIPQKAEEVLQEEENPFNYVKNHSSH